MSHVNHPEYQALLREVVSYPADPFARGVLQDWLADRGLPPVEMNDEVGMTLEQWVKHGRNVVLLLPVRRVVATDKRPYQFGFNKPGSFFWFAHNAGWSSPAFGGPASNVPVRTYSRMVQQGAKFGGISNSNLATEEEAFFHLSWALINGARKQAGLRLLKREEVR